MYSWQHFLFQVSSADTNNNFDQTLALKSSQTIVKVKPDIFLMLGWGPSMICYIRIFFQHLLKLSEKPLPQERNLLTSTLCHCRFPVPQNLMVEIGLIIAKDTGISSSSSARYQGLC